MRCNKNFRAESTTKVGHVGLVNRPRARILERFDPDGFSPASIPHARSLEMETPVGWLPGLWDARRPTVLLFCRGFQALRVLQCLESSRLYFEDQGGLNK